jgi:hypothetical protein
VKVVYKNIGDNFTRETTTNAEGSFTFDPEFTYGYYSFGFMTVGLQVSISLKIKTKHNWSKSGYFVRNEDTDHALIQAGTIEIDSFFLKSD